MKYTTSRRPLPDSALVYTLQALIPYSRANIKLAFKPQLFFEDLEKISRKKRQTIRNAYYKAQQKGLIELDDFGVPRLTDKGYHHIRQFKPKTQPVGSYLMVAFDIPEAERWKRRHLRLLLQELNFSQVQKSVWVTQNDYRDYLAAEIKQYGLEKYVAVFEASPVFLS